MSADLVSITLNSSTVAAQFQIATVKADGVSIDEPMSAPTRCASDAYRDEARHKLTPWLGTQLGLCRVAARVREQRRDLLGSAL